jgi:hypothetical protein
MAKPKGRKIADCHEGPEPTQTWAMMTKETDYRPELA